jgi:hypothetical protein
MTPTLSAVEHNVTNTTHLLWTGGWDSTFRLLQLLFDERTNVQPWYLVHEERPSVPWEYEAMGQIRKALENAMPGARKRLRPTRVVDVGSLAPAPDLTAMACRLRLGSQYEWLPRFAREYGLDGLEISVEFRPGRVQAMLAPLLVESVGPGGLTLRVDPDHIADGDPDLALFSAFSFPLIRVTKQEMLREARARRWEPLLALTWFCHNPKKGRPCGSCTPCLIAVEEGFSHRIPLIRRLRPRLRLLKRRLTAPPFS